MKTEIKIHIKKHCSQTQTLRSSDLIWRRWRRQRTDNCFSIRVTLTTASSSLSTTMTPASADTAA